MQEKITETIEYIPANDYKLKYLNLIKEQFFGVACSTLSSGLKIARAYIRSYIIVFEVTGAITIAGKVQGAAIVADVIGLVMILVQEQQIQQMDHAFQEMEKIFEKDQLSFLKQNLSYLKQQSECIQLKLVELKKEIDDNPNLAQESDKQQKMVMKIIKASIDSILVLFSTIENTYINMNLSLEDLKKRSKTSKKYSMGIRILGVFSVILSIFGVGAVIFSGPICWMVLAGSGFSMITSISLIMNNKEMKKLENQLTQGIQLITKVQTNLQKCHEDSQIIQRKILHVNGLIEQGGQEQLQPIIDHLNQNSENLLQEIRDSIRLIKNVAHFYYNDSCYICLKDFEETEEIHIFSCNHIICSQCLPGQLKNFPGKCPVQCNSNGVTRTGLFYKFCSTEI